MIKKDGLLCKKEIINSLREDALELLSKIEIKEQTKNKPFTGLNFPKHISKRPNLMV